MPDEAGTDANALEKELSDAQDAPESGADDKAATRDESTTTDSQSADPYEKRYNDLRPQYDRTQSELKQYRDFIESLQNEETQAQALQALGLALDDEDEDELDLSDPDVQIAEIREYLQAQENQRAEQYHEELLDQYVDQELDRIEKEVGSKLSDDHQALLYSIASSNPDEDGLPDFDYANKALSGWGEANRKAYLESKKAERLEVGTAGTKELKLDNPTERADALAEMIEAGRDAD